jgi:hypothetical protein
MPFVHSANGEAKNLTAVLTSQNRTYKLFTACATVGGVPTPASVVGDFTEATFTGYAAKTVTGTISGSTWSAPTGTPALSQYNAAAPLSWTATGGYQTILGYFVVLADGSYLGAETYQNPVILSSGSPNCTLIPAELSGTSPTPTS